MTIHPAGFEYGGENKAIAAFAMVAGHHGRMNDSTRTLVRHRTFSGGEVAGARTQRQFRYRRGGGILAKLGNNPTAIARSASMAAYPLARNTRHKRRDYLAILGLSVLVTATISSRADEPVGRTAVARPAAEWNKDGKPVKLEFDFGDFKAWARRDGSWSADGTVQHRGLMCGTYTLLLRVGRGNPGCVDVQWFGEPRAVASEKLCNDAPGPLTGGNNEFRNAARFDEITCAERVISCTGNCK